MKAPYKQPITILDTRRSLGLPSSTLNRRRAGPWKGYLLIIALLGAFWFHFVWFLMRCFK